MGMASIKLSENESKVSKIIEKVLSNEIAANPNVKEICSIVKLAPYSLGENVPRVLIVYVETGLLIFLRKYYRDFITSQKKELRNTMILTVRNKEIPAKKDPLAVVRQREEILYDICFPATVMARSQDVESINDILQHIYLDNKQQYWSNAEMSAIEILASKLFKEKFVV